MSKSLRTQQCYAVAFWDQGKLTGFGFKSPSYSPRVHGMILRGKSSLSPVVEPNQQPTAQPPPQPKPSLLTLGPSWLSWVRLASVLSDPSTVNDEETRPGLGDVAENEETESRRSDLEEVTNQNETEVEDLGWIGREHAGCSKPYLRLDWPAKGYQKSPLKKLQNITIVSSESISYYFKFCNPSNQRIIAYPGKPQDCKAVAWGTGQLVCLKSSGACSPLSDFWKTSYREAWRGWKFKIMDAQWAS